MSKGTTNNIYVGDSAEYSKTITESDIVLFAEITGDMNPVHLDQEWAKITKFKDRIAHGMLSAGLISAAISMKLPGPGTIYVSQELNFIKPVFIGDTITARVEVVELIPEKQRMKLRTTCINQDKQLVIDGVAVVLPPKTDG